MIKRIHVISVSLLLAGALQAQVFFNRSFLNEQEAATSVTAAAGGVYAADPGNPMQAVMNPALLAGGEGNFTVYGQLRGLQRREIRTFPVLDSFDSFLADNIYVQNHRFTADYDAGIRYTRGITTLAVAYSNRYDLTYRYDEEVRGSLYSVYNRDPLIGYHSVEFSGGIHAVTVAGAVRLFDRLNIGASMSMLSGENLSDAYGVTVLGVPADNLASDTTTFFFHDYSMENTEEIFLGLEFDITERVSIQGSARLSPELAFSGVDLINGYEAATGLPSYTMGPDSLDMDVTAALPDKYSLGFSYMPENVLPTRLYMQLDYLDWGAMDMKDEDSTASALSNRWTIRAGIAHEFFTGVPFRLGFSYQPSPVTDILNRSVLSIGSGFVSGPARLDFAVNFTETRYRYPDLFPIAGEIRNDLDTVREQEIHYTFSLTVDL